MDYRPPRRSRGLGSPFRGIYRLHYIIRFKWAVLYRFCPQIFFGHQDIPGLLLHSAASCHSPYNILDGLAVAFCIHLPLDFFSSSEQPRIPGSSRRVMAFASYLYLDGLSGGFCNGFALRFFSVVPIPPDCCPLSRICPPTGHGSL
jgi:hypothetical protein